MLHRRPHLHRLGGDPETHPCDYVLYENHPASKQHPYIHTLAMQLIHQQDNGWFGWLADGFEAILKVLDSGLEQLNVPYSYGFAIILLTVMVKVATYPLSKAQVESTISMQALQPRVRELQARYKNDPEKLQLETARVYREAGVNPLAGCLPTIATIPVFIGLYKYEPVGGWTTRMVHNVCTGRCQTWRMRDCSRRDSSGFRPWVARRPWQCRQRCETPLLCTVQWALVSHRVVGCRGSFPSRMGLPPLAGRMPLPTWSCPCCSWRRSGRRRRSSALP